MKIIRDIKELSKDIKLAVTIGNFDGIHLGHRELINKLKSEAMTYNFKTAVVTFLPHPQIYFNKEILLINDDDKKKEIFEQLGIDYYIELKFDQFIAELSPENFFTNILTHYLNIKMIVVGANYKFGYKKIGDIYLLKDLADKVDIKTYFIDNVLGSEGEIISSSICRQLILSGNIKRVNRFLSRSFSTVGKIVSGDGIGRAIGFPTANIRVENTIIPLDGVYATQIEIDKRIYNSMTYIGCRPSINILERRVEVNIFDQFDSLYDKHVELLFIDFIREEIKFDSLDLLIEQLKLDKVVVQNYFLTGGIK